MDYLKRRLRLLSGLLIVFVLLVAIGLLLAFNVGGVGAELTNTWSTLNDRWGDVKPTEVWTAANGTVTLVVVLVGGLAGYLRFLRRREMHASCDLTLTATMVPIAEGQAIKVVTTVMNAGSYQLIFSGNTQQFVDVISADSVMWDDVLQHGGQMIWSLGLTQSQALLESEGRRVDPDNLEPGQSLERTLLFPVSRSAVAFSVRVYVEACPRWIATQRTKQKWSTELVLTANEMSPGGSQHG